MLLRLSYNDICLGNRRINVCHEARLLTGGERHILWASMVPDFMEEAIPNCVSSSERHVLLYMSVQLVEEKGILVGPLSRSACGLKGVINEIIQAMIQASYKCLDSHWLSPPSSSASASIFGRTVAFALWQQIARCRHA